jgi:hypothetical protein
MSDQPDNKEGGHLAKLMEDVQELEETNILELTDKQRQITKLQMRGFGPGAIAKTLGITITEVHANMKAIRNKTEKLGATLSQDYVVGESLNLYAEIEQRGWELYSLARGKEKVGEALKALNLVMTARKNGVGFLQDVGVLRRAKVEHEHKVEMSPLVQQWSAGDAQKRMVIQSIVGTQLEDLPDPVPPEPMEPVSEDTALAEPEPPPYEEEP